MKIKLSKSQWEEMGRKSGWITAQVQHSYTTSKIEIDSMIKLMISLKDALKFHSDSEIDEGMNIDFINDAIKDSEMCLKNLKDALINEGFDISNNSTNIPEKNIK